MKILVSPTTLEEVQTVVEVGTDIVDIKNVVEGSLGAHAPWVVQAILQRFQGRAQFSATLGDLPYKPGTAALAAYGAAHCDLNYIKAGLYGPRTYEEARELMTAIVRGIRMASKEIKVVASGYADFRRFGGAHFLDIVKAAKEAAADVVMVDTAIKDGQGLFDAMTLDEIEEFVEAGHEAGLEVALAGSIRMDDIKALTSIDPDIVGIRGVLCEDSDRTQGITKERMVKFFQTLETVMA